MTLTATLEKFKIVEMAKAAVLETPQLSKQATCQHQGTSLMNTLSDCGRAVDLSGQVFGLWTVLHRDANQIAQRGKPAKWICRCECGREKSVFGSSLRSGDSRSCGCLLTAFNKRQTQERRSDLSGQKFGRYTVLRHDTETVKNGGRMPNYICQCDCGSPVRSVSRQALVKGDAKSCGCLHKEIVSNAAHDLSGLVFGRLTVIDRADVVKRRRGQGAKWNCQCECGKTKTVGAAALKSGATQSCGCLQRENFLRIGAPTRFVGTHKLSGERIYRSWQAMKARCQNPANPAYKDYGGRGIEVCQEWQSFEVFRGWALSNGYQDDLTIERIEVNGNYCPENCRFIPKSEQPKNRRNSLKITAWGETKTASEWVQDDRCKATSANTLKARIYRGQPPELAISAPQRPRSKAS